MYETDQPARTILLVEDQAIIALSESKMLESLGYRVSVAMTGEVALERFSQIQPDMVLMDIDLGPGIDGTETARRILSEYDVPIVLLTSHSEKNFVDHVRSITRYGYILKHSGAFVMQTSIEMAFDLFAAHRNRSVQEQRFDEMVGNAPAGYFRLGPDRCVESVNAAWLRMHGYESAQEVIGSPFLSFQPADTIKRAARRLDAMYQGRQIPTGEGTRRLRDGTVGHHVFSASPVTEAGRVVGVEAFIIDTTDLHHAHEQLSENQIILNAVIESVRDGVVVSNRLAMVEKINAAAAALLDQPIENCVGRPLADLMAAVPPDCHTTRRPIYRAQPQGDPEISAYVDVLAMPS